MASPVYESKEIDGISRPRFGLRDRQTIGVTLISTLASGAG